MGAMSLGLRTSFKGCQEPTEGRGTTALKAAERSKRTEERNKAFLFDADKIVTDLDEGSFSRWKPDCWEEAEERKPRQEQ